MNLQEELLINRSLEPGYELLLSVLLTRERIVHLADEQLFKPEGITEPQFNVLRILCGGPKKGYPICEIRRRLIMRNADVPRLVDRMVRLGLVRRSQDPVDGRACRVQITAKGENLARNISPRLDALASALGKTCSPTELGSLLHVLGRIRETALKQISSDPIPLQ